MKRVSDFDSYTMAKLLDKDPSDLKPWQMLRVIEYLEARVLEEEKRVWEAEIKREKAVLDHGSFLQFVCNHIEDLAHKGIRLEEDIKKLKHDQEEAQNHPQKSEEA